MSFIIDYDILKKIKESNHGKPVLHYDKFVIIGTLIYAGCEVVKKTTNGKIVSDAIMDVTIPFTVANMVGVGISFLKKCFSNPGVKISANITLEELVNKLAKLEVNTSLELLKDAKINTIEYEMVYVDDCKASKIKQNKYIDIPLNNGYTETILQEHLFGDDEYEISVESLVKEKTLKLAKT